MEQLAPLPRCPFKSDKIPWTDQIAKYLDGESLANLAMTCRWLEQEMTDDTVWKFACLRDLKVHDPQVPMAFTWRQLYASVFSKSPTLLLYTCEEKVLDRKRIGGFIFESPVALVMGKFILPDMIEEDTLESSQKLLASGYCELHNIRTGIWIADLKKIKNISRGEYVIFEARYIKLSLNEAYMAGGWIYKELGYHHISEHANAAPCGIVDFEHIRDPSTSEVFDLKSWAGKEKINYIDSCTSLHGVAININYPPNDGYRARVRAVRDEEGDVVGIQIILKQLEKYYYN